MKTYPDLSGLITFPYAKNKKRWQVAILGVLSHSFVNDFNIYIYIHTARALCKNVGCRWPGSLNFLSERPHVCRYIYIIYIYTYNYSVEGPLIS